MKRRMAATASPKALKPKMAGPKAAPKKEAAGQAPKVEAKETRVDPKAFSSRVSTPKKNESDVYPAGKVPAGKMPGKMGKKLHNVRI